MITYIDYGKEQNNCNFLVSLGFSKHEVICTWFLKIQTGPKELFVFEISENSCVGVFGTLPMLSPQWNSKCSSRVQLSWSWNSENCLFGGDFYKNCESLDFGRWYQIMSPLAFQLLHLIAGTLNSENQPTWRVTFSLLNSLNSIFWVLDWTWVFGVPLDAQISEFLQSALRFLN